MNPTSPPPPNESRASSLIIVSSVLHAVSLPIAATRLWTRWRPELRLWWDDYMILAALAVDFVHWILILLSIRHGLGRPAMYLAPPDLRLAKLYLWFGQLASGWAIAFAKLSIACMLLRLRRDSMKWKIFLCGMMALSVSVAVTISIFLLLACQPVRGVWDFDYPNAACMPIPIMSIGILVTSALTITTDLILALLPLTFVMHIRRSVRERILLVFIMGLGLVASAASICKIGTVTGTKPIGDPLVDFVYIMFWGTLEQQLAITAACIPCLKRLAERILHKLGLVSSRTPTFYHLDRQNSAAGRIHRSTTDQPSTCDTAMHADASINSGDVTVLEMTPRTSTGDGTASKAPNAWDAVTT